MMLHGYFRGSAFWQVRIAANLKNAAPQQHLNHLRINPQGLAPAAPDRQPNAD